MLIALKNLFKELFALRLGKLEDYFWAIFGTIIMITIPSKIVDFFLEPVSQAPPDSIRDIYDVISGPQDPFFYSVLITTCLIGPVLEELLFRGVFWKCFERLIDKHYAFFITSLLFAYAHVDPYHIIGVLPIGIYIGWLRLKSNSIFPSVLAHITNNIVVFLLVINL